MDQECKCVDWFIIEVKSDFLDISLLKVTVLVVQTCIPLRLRLQLIEKV